MKKTITLLLALLMMMSLAACGSNAPATGSQDDKQASGTAASEKTKESASDEPVDAEITESGYSVDDGFLYYSVTLHNPNDDYAIEMPSYRVTAKDESGTILGTMEHTLSVIYPGQDFEYAFQAFECDVEPASVEFTIIPAADYNFVKPSKLEHASFEPLEVVGANIKDDGSMPSVLGEVKNNNDYDIEDAVVVVYFRDAEGNLLGGASTFVSHVPAGGTAAFDIDVYANIATDNFEVYANNWI